MCMLFSVHNDITHFHLIYKDVPCSYIVNNINSYENIFSGSIIVQESRYKYNSILTVPK